jgi:PilZ domain
MKLSDRRLAQRFPINIPLHIRAWNSQGPEQIVESINVSECGAYYKTDAPPSEGAMMQIRLEMPTEITGNPTVEWRCTAKVTRVQPASSPGALLGVSVRFDYYEVSRTTTPLQALDSSRGVREALSGMIKI